MAPVLECPGLPMKTLEDIQAIKSRGMGHFVRPMRMADIAQVTDVEQECFPVGWSPTPFRRELQTKTSFYLVGCSASDPTRAEDEATMFIGVPEQPEEQPKPVLLRLVEGLRSVIAPGAGPAQDFTQYVAGYVGLWFILEEAHVTAIGVRERDRRHGIGELLLIASIESALRRGSREVTLETRVSNTPAQNLYLKYGFNRMGIRKGYYTDNREDALIMTTDPITSLEYRARLDRLSQQHAQRWGESIRYLG